MRTGLPTLRFHQYKILVVGQEKRRDVPVLFHVVHTFTRRYSPAKAPSPRPLVPLLAKPAIAEPAAANGKRRTASGGAEAAAKRKVWELGVKTLGPMSSFGENCLADIDSDDESEASSGERRVRFADEQSPGKKKEEGYDGRRPYEYTAVAVGSTTVARLTREEWVEIVM